MKKRDFLLIGAILLVSVVLLFATRLGKRAGGAVVVRVAGEEQGTYPLAVDGTYPLNGGTNVLKIEGGKAWMAEANCPDHYCMSQGSIRNTNETITCLPNKLTVTVVGGGDDFVEIVG